MEFAIDVANACHERHIHTIAVTAGYINPEPARELFGVIDATNVDLKGFSEAFYHELCGGKLAPVLDTLRYLRQHTKVWLEITTLLIPGKNDGEPSLQAMCHWIANELGPEVPLHFSAFHPDFHLLDVPPTPTPTLLRAREIARHNGLQHVYIGNARGSQAQSTWCLSCKAGGAAPQGGRGARCGHARGVEPVRKIQKTALINNRLSRATRPN